MTAAHPCPDDRQFQNALSGRASADDTQTFADHLEVCPACAEQFERCVEDDTLLEAIREQATVVSAPDPAAAAVIERLLKLPFEAKIAVESATRNPTQERREAELTPRAKEHYRFLMPPTEADEIGRLGPYRILKELGAGGMGVVFQAEDLHLKRLVALKVMKPEAAGKPGARERFLREAQAAAKVEHEHIVTIYQVGEANDVPFMAMQCLKGHSLDDYLKRPGPMKPAQAVRVGRQVALGLAAAHEHGLIHRDIKPANIWIENVRGGHVKLLDFGLARPIIDDMHLTQSGTIMGTPAYMAPEQAHGDKVDHRCDLFSLGVVLYRMTTGQLPFAGETPVAILVALAVQSPATPESLGVALPPELSALIMQLLEKDPSKRPASANEIAERLTSIAQALPAAPKTDGAQAGAAAAPATAASPTGATDSALVERLSLAPSIAAVLQPSAEPGTAPIAETSPSSKKKMLIGTAIGAAFLGIAMLAAVVFKVRTKDGTLVVHVNQPDATIQVFDEAGKIEITQPGEKGTVSISVDPGKHRLKVEKDGFAVFGTEFTIDAGGSQPIEATLEPLGSAGGHRPAEVAMEPLGKAIAGNTSSVASADSGKPWERRAFKGWMKAVAALPADKQVEAVAKKLQELNPRFDGKVGSKIENDAVVAVDFSTVHVSDISPVRALPRLLRLSCTGTVDGPVVSDLTDISPLKGLALEDLDIAKSHVSDLSPLAGMRLASFSAWDCLVSDLRPLHGMPLNALFLSFTQVTDLSALKGMPLRKLVLHGSNVADLSPLKGMPLVNLTCDRTKVTDLSPLEGMPLKALGFTPRNIVKGIAVIRHIEGLTINGTWDGDKVWPITTPIDPAFQQWVNQALALSAEEQVVAVAKKLQELNPGFDGKLMPKIEAGEVTELTFLTDNVADISPVRALLALKALSCRGSGRDQGKLMDLSPLTGMKLEKLDCGNTTVFDLAALKNVPSLTTLICDNAPISDLSPLKELPLTRLNCSGTTVTDLSPLDGMKLTELLFADTQVSDLSPLKGMPLTSLDCSQTMVSDLSAIQRKSLKTIRYDARLWRDFYQLRSIASLEQINNLPAAEYWKTVAAKRAVFDRWCKRVGGLPPEKQVEAVAAKLVELNPGFDGKVSQADGAATPQIERGLVADLGLASEHVTDISPLRALTGLQRLACPGNFNLDGSHWGTLSDLSPLEGMKLTRLNVAMTHVSDLSPLRGMPLTYLGLTCTRVSDLSPLQGMPLKWINLPGSKVADLSPLRHTKLESLDCSDTAVSDLSPLAGLNLIDIQFTPQKIVKGFDAIRQMKSVKTIGARTSQSAPVSQFPAVEFWKKYDAGEFK
jgi:Leucine-rich repeat (LRR) protein